MTEKEARELATQVAKQSHGVRVKFGCTNGRRCLHLIVNHPDQGLAYSETIYEPWEWADHEENLTERPKRRERRDEDMDIQSAVRNKEAQ